MEKYINIPSSSKVRRKMAAKEEDKWQ